MKKIRWYLHTGFVGGDLYGEFEVEDDAPEDEIEAEAKENAFCDIDWGWEEAQKK